MFVAKTLSVLLLGVLLLTPSLVQCIHVENRIINGQNAVHRPHHVYISFQNANGGGFFGAGSIITQTHVLTVAQVVRGFVTWNVGYGSNEFSLLTWMRTAQAIAHPNYNVDSRENDIAVLVMPTPFQWSAGVQPIPLAPASQKLPLPNEQGTIVGFGWTGSDAVQANQLQEGFVRVIPDQQCQHIIAVSFPNHFCASDAVIPANICQGDLGGGFLTHYRNQVILTGLSSILVEGCNTAWPSAYTRVYPFVSWIRSVTEA